MFKLLMKGKSKKGFTLVELMVVVAIIGILVVIAVPVYKNSQNKAEQNACKANQRTINGAIQLYKYEEGTDPASVAALVPDYLASEPVCPTTKTEYTITPASGSAAAHVTCGEAGHALP